MRLLGGCSQGRRRRNEKGALGESQGGRGRRPRRARTGGGWRGCGAEKRVGEEHPPASAASEGRWQAPCEAPSGFSALRSRVVVLGTWASGGGRRRARGQTTAPKGLVLSAAGRPDRVLALAVGGIVRSARLRRVHMVTEGVPKKREGVLGSVRRGASKGCRAGCPAAWPRGWRAAVRATAASPATRRAPPDPGGGPQSSGPSPCTGVSAAAPWARSRDLK